MLNFIRGTVPNLYRSEPENSTTMRRGITFSDTRDLISKMDDLINDFETLDQLFRTSSQMTIGKKFKCGQLRQLPLNIHMQKNSISSEAFTQTRVSFDDIERLWRGGKRI